MVGLVVVRKMVCAWTPPEQHLVRCPSKSVVLSLHTSPDGRRTRHSGRTCGLRTLESGPSSQDSLTRDQRGIRIEDGRGNCTVVHVSTTTGLALGGAKGRDIIIYFSRGIRIEDGRGNCTVVHVSTTTGLAPGGAKGLGHFQEAYVSRTDEVIAPSYMFLRRLG